MRYQFHNPRSLAPPSRRRPRRDGSVPAPVLGGRLGRGSRRARRATDAAIPPPTRAQGAPLQPQSGRQPVGAPSAKMAGSQEIVHYTPAVAAMSRLSRLCRGYVAAVAAMSRLSRLYRGCVAAISRLCRGYIAVMSRLYRARVGAMTALCLGYVRAVWAMSGLWLG